MAQAIAMQHDVDPATVLWNALAPMLDGIEVLGARCLVAIYQIPTRTAGGIELPDSFRKENDFQGKIGLVMKKGPLAFVDDASHRFGEVIPEVGSWVLFHVGDAYGFELGTARCRFVEDVDIFAIMPRPDMAW